MLVVWVIFAILLCGLIFEVTLLTVLVVLLWIGLLPASGLMVECLFAVCCFVAVYLVCVWSVFMFGCNFGVLGFVSVV